MVSWPFSWHHGLAVVLSSRHPSTDVPSPSPFSTSRAPPSPSPCARPPVPHLSLLRGRLNTCASSAGCAGFYRGIVHCGHPRLSVVLTDIIRHAVNGALHSVMREDGSTSRVHSFKAAPVHTIETRRGRVSFGAFFWQRRLELSGRNRM